MAPSGMADTDRVHKGPLYCPNGHFDLYYKEKKVCKSNKTISLEVLGRKRRVLCSDHNVEVSIASTVGTVSYAWQAQPAVSGTWPYYRRGLW